MHSTFWQSVLIGWSQRLNFWNQSDPKRFSVFFSTKTFNFLVIPFTDTGIIISRSNLILSPVTVCAVLLVIFIIGLFNFPQVCKFIIDRSEPESNWNLTDLFNTLTVMYLRTTLPDSTSRFVCVFNFSVSTLWAFMSGFIAVLTFFFFLYDRDSLWPHVPFHCSSKLWVFLFFCCLSVLKFWVIIFSLFYRRVWLGSILDFPYVSNTRLLDSFSVFSGTHYRLRVFSQFLKCEFGFIL